MLVLCPTCKTKYRVDENKIGPEGAKIRCAKCQTIFRVSRKPPAAQAPAPTPPVAAKPAPAPAPKAPAPSAAELEVTGPMMPKTMPKAELLLADADEIFLNKIGDELISAGYAVWYARDGEAALRFIQEKRPPAAILEVMLPGLFGFEVCEKVKADPSLSEVKLVLIGSVYEKNRFRRAPTSLYGADEYVDKYHDGVEVLAKVEKVLGFAPPEQPAESTGEETAAAPSVEIAPPPPPAPKPAPRPVAPPAAPRPVAPAVPPARPAPAQPTAARPAVQPAPQRPVPAPPTRPVAPPAPPLRPAAEPVPPVAPKPAPAKPAAAAQDWTKSVPDDPSHQKAARLARTIASDIALYNPELVERGVREGNFWELLAKDIDDGRKHYLSKVSPEIRASADYFQLALEDLITKRRKKLGLS